MSVTKLIFDSSPALVAEMAFFGQTNEGHQAYAKLKTKADIERHVESSSEYRDLMQFVERVKHGRVLDVGVAYGITSAYLAIKGFEVVALEPSLRLCEDMDVFFRNHGLKISVANGTGESMGSLGGQFDAVVFYSSLHHCDDVDAALSNAFRLLRPSGVVFLFEPVLKFYRSKEWFYRMLVESPGTVGHYGGNEHIYRFLEYTGFLKKAGFRSIEALPSLNYQAQAKRAPWDSPARYFLKRSYYTLMKFGFLSLKPIRSVLAQLNLLNTVLFAEKPQKKI